MSDQQVVISEADLEVLERYRRAQSRKGKKGGRSRSEAKVRATRANIKIAQQARLQPGVRAAVPSKPEPYTGDTPLPDYVPDADPVPDEG